VLLVAAVAKLADRPGSRRALENFGVPARLAAPFALVVPLAELVIAAALLPRATAAGAALAAAALLLVFTAAIALNLARGRSPDCHCFGQLHSAPAGWRTLARNAALIGLAGLVAWQGRDDAGASALVLVDWARPAELAGLGLLMLGGWFGYHLLRQHGRLLLRIEALEQALATAAQAPAQAPGPHVVEVPGGTNGHRPPRGLALGTAIELRLPDLDGNEASLADYRGKRVLLVHWSPSCGFCDMIAPDLAALERDLRKRDTEIVLVAHADAEANRALLEEHGLRVRALLLQGSRPEVFDSLGTPVAYLLDEDGRVARPLAVGANEVPELAREAASSAKKRHSKLAVEPLPAGAVAPPFTLPDLSGEEISLASYRGRKVLLVFSDPQCGACDELLAELVRRERGNGNGGPELMVVGRGDPDANRQKAATHSIEFPYLLQRKWTVAEAYGTYATPAAYLVDEEGAIARDVAMGLDAVLKLAGEA
jgi:peroxiredoxin